MKTSKANLIVIDIETVPTMNLAIAERLKMNARLAEPKHNTRKDDKLRWDTEEAIQEREQEAWSKTAVDVLLAEPIVACMFAKFEPMSEALFHESDWDMRFPSPSGDPDVDWDQDLDFFQRIGDPEGMLYDLNEYLHEAVDEQTVFVGHNLNFDLAVLLNAFHRYDILPPKDFPQYRNGYFRGRIFDTMKNAPNNNGLGYVKMSALCEAYGLPAAKELNWRGIPMDGSRVLDAYLEGELELVLKYCRQDVLDTYSLYVRMTHGGKWGTFDLNREIERLIQEIRESEASDATKALNILKVLETARVVPGLN